MELIEGVAFQQYFTSLVSRIAFGLNDLIVLLRREMMT